jgi:hypothetical protein
MSSSFDLSKNRTFVDWWFDNNICTEQYPQQFYLWHQFLSKTSTAEGNFYKNFIDTFLACIRLFFPRTSLPFYNSERNRVPNTGGSTARQSIAKKKENKKRIKKKPSLLSTLWSQAFFHCQSLRWEMKSSRHSTMSSIKLAKPKIIVLINFCVLL